MYKILIKYESENEITWQPYKITMDGKNWVEFSTDDLKSLEFQVDLLGMEIGYDRIKIDCVGN